MKKHTLYKSILLATSAIGAGFAMPVVAQQENTLQLEEIVVTARRREERLQDVPISMTVFDQDQLNNANITNASDIATYTPSLYANERFGSDSSTFAIRGFSQELRTTASVGVYFAEVVAARGSNTSQSGDGAGPGDFFDLENVQVLKGPQGTLFGRNTTGGAVLLSPKKPTDEFEGYVEGSLGNFDMRRAQGVVNIPVNDAFRVRLGVDTQQRDGYLTNIIDIGPDKFADIDYTAFRGSVVWDITDSVENYTIFKYNESSNNGSPYSIIACNNSASPFGVFCAQDLAQRAATGGDGFYDVASTIEDSFSDQELFQVINTTTWEVNDNLTVKNILSYAEQTIEQQFALYGTNWNTSALAAFLPPGTPVASMPFTFQLLAMRDGMPIADSSTLVEEIQLQGTAMDDRLTWQAGLYYEKTEPESDYGSQTPSQMACDLSTINSTNPADWRCNDAFGPLVYGQGLRNFGSMASNPGGVEYTNKAIYAQGTYDISEQLSLTAGLRYTDDETKGYITESVYYFPGSFVQNATFPYTGYPFPGPNPVTQTRTPEASSDEPTWLIGLDYKPTEDTLLYAKYARGYRQGSVNLGAPAGLDTHDPEQVDTYEIGSKTLFDSPVPTTLNVSVFYNDFTDQQIQQGMFRTTGVGTTAILNAGSSEIWGVEIDGVMQLTDNFNLAASYAYLDSEIKELESPLSGLNQGELIALGIARLSGLTTAEGEPLSFTPENKLVLTASYILPIDEALGTMTASVTYVYNDEMQAVSQAASALAVLPDYDLINLNFNWDQVAGSPVDASLFVTNLADEEYITYITGNWNNGLEAGRVGAPRMLGARVKYNF